MRNAGLPITLGVLAVLALGSTAHAEDDSRGYFLRLIGKHGIYRKDSDDPASWSKLMLVKRSGLRGHGLEVVERVRAVAVSHGRIIGATDRDYFIFEPPDGDGRLLQGSLSRFGDQAEWRSALKALGISESIQLLDPDQIAATRSGMELREWDYIFFRGLLGLSDRELIGWFVLVLTALVFAFNFWRPKLLTIFLTTLFLGIPATIAFAIQQPTNQAGLAILAPLVAFPFVGFVAHMIRGPANKQALDNGLLRPGSRVEPDGPEADDSADDAENETS